MDPIKDAVKSAAAKIADAAATPDVPGKPGSATPAVEEPAGLHGPLPPSAEQGQPAPHSPTGAPSAGDRAQQGAYLTMSAGTRLRDTDHSLKAGPRGPLLLQDHHFREKITHFDHERIPERVVHARGAGAHGVFTSYGTAAGLTRTRFLGKGVETPVFVRFSTVLGSRGSADTVRDTRGFATKFYTEEGNFDLVGNNMPVFFIQDAIKFPDIIHAAKWHPDREICSSVAEALGLPVPAPDEPLAEVAPSPALSQVGGTWPADGRLIGIVAGPDADLDAVGALREAVFAAGLTPLIIGPHGGQLGPLTVQRTFATARSVEFDAILLATAPPPAPDAIPARDEKAGAAGNGTVDPRVLLLVEEAWRHAKAIAAWDGGAAVLEQTGVAGTPGVVTAGSATEALTAVQGLLPAHRVWERF